MSIADLTAQLSALSDSLKTTNTLISRLAKLRFQPGSEPLDGESGVRIELAQDIHESLKQLEEELELLKQEAEDYQIETGNRRRQSTKDGEQARLTAKLVRIGEELTHSRQQFRNAQITAKFASDEAKRKEREAVIEGYRKEADQLPDPASGANGFVGGDRDLLFARRGGAHRQQKQLTKDEILINASSDVTAALRRTHDLLGSELSRSRYAQEIFDESKEALSQLGEKYEDLSTILSNSRNLLGTLLRSQKSDTWYLETAFYVLLTTLCWLFFRRILFGPFFKLPLFLWNVFAFLANWLLLKPLFLFLSVTGVITSEPLTTSLRPPPITTSRAPLIIQPSAKGGPPRYPGNPPRGVPAGAGGAGAKAGRNSRLAGDLSERIGKMAEESTRQNQGTARQEPQQQQQQQPPPPRGGNEPQRRGDGTILQERDEIPKNPKKKNFEADVEDAKHAEAQQGEARRKRDEL